MSSYPSKISSYVASLDVLLYLDSPHSYLQLLSAWN